MWPLQLAQERESSLVVLKGVNVSIRASEEALVVAAQQVSAATTQLVMASTVKADPNSENQQRLRGAATKVTAATEGLEDGAVQRRGRLVVGIDGHQVADRRPQIEGHPPVFRAARAASDPDDGARGGEHVEHVQ